MQYMNQFYSAEYRVSFQVYIIQFSHEGTQAIYILWAFHLLLK